MRKLKIKIKSLAAEARFIRREEGKELSHARYLLKTRGPDDRYTKMSYLQYRAMIEHRKHEVRKAARNTLLAYCFLRGREYAQVENPVMTRSQPNWEEVERMVMKYAEGDTRTVAQRFAEWKASAKPPEEQAA